MTYQYLVKATNLRLLSYFVLYNKRSTEVHTNYDYVTLPRTQFYRILINKFFNTLKLPFGHYQEKTSVTRATEWRNSSYNMLSP